MAKFIVGPDKIVPLLFEAGVLDGDMTYYRRIVIDLEVGAAAKIYTEQFADDEKLTVGLKAALEFIVPDEEEKAA